MFETCLPLRVAPAALSDESWRDFDYTDCWQDLPDQFTGWALLEALDKTKGDDDDDDEKGTNIDDPAYHVDRLH
jgi:hypothetical protein